MNDFITDHIFAITLILIIGAVVVAVGLGMYKLSVYKCISSHTEIQYQMPPGMVMGGGKDGGGVSIPLGNARPINVTVCDKYVRK